MLPAPVVIASSRTRDRWAAELAARARAYWTEARTAELARGKALLVPPAEAAPLLRALGLLDHNASLPPSRVPKYFQIKHMLALLAPALRELRAQHPVIHLLDAGCGRSYLTLLIASRRAPSPIHRTSSSGRTKCSKTRSGGASTSMLVRNESLIASSQS